MQRIFYNRPKEILAPLADHALTMRMVIDQQDELNAFCEALSGKDFITVDTEFLREKTYYPKLCLIQIGDPDKNAAAIDPLSGNIDLQPVFDLLCNPDILKVFHAGRQDLEIFYRLMDGNIPHPFFDTQIAAMVCGYGDQIGYDNLVRQITGAQIDKSNQFTDWSYRPLSDKQIDYALGDVTHLVDIYHHLSQELEKRGRTRWVFEEEEILMRPATYENTPDEMWQKIKVKSPKPRTLAILKNLAAWREAKAQRQDRPKNWIMRDEILADIAMQAPKSSKDLAKIRNMSSDVANGKTGKELLSLVQEALQSPKDNWPQPKKRKILPPNIMASIDILKMLLKVNAYDQEVAPKVIASADDLEALALHADKSEQNNDVDLPPATSIAALQGWRYDVFGKDAQALLSGQLCIGLKNGTIIKHYIKES